MTADPKKFGLTDKHIACLDFVSKGKTVAQISQIMGLSEHAIILYQRGIKMKLEATTMAHAVGKALRSGIIE